MVVTRGVNGEEPRLKIQSKFRSKLCREDAIIMQKQKGRECQSAVAYSLGAGVGAGASALTTRGGGGVAVVGHEDGGASKNGAGTGRGNDVGGRGKRRTGSLELVNDEATERHFEGRCGVCSECERSWRKKKKEEKGDEEMSQYLYDSAWRDVDIRHD